MRTKRRWLFLPVFLTLVLSMGRWAAAEEWSIAGHYAEACSCDAACPCVYGSPPTMGHCHEALAFDITKGKYGQTNLSGLKFVSTMEMGKGTWIAYYLDEKSTPDQRQALESIFKKLLGGFAKEDLGAKAVRISMASEDKGKARAVAIPNVLKFRVEKPAGLDGESPVVIANPGRHFIPMLTVARSTQDEFSDHGKNWSYKDKSGFHGEFSFSSSQPEQTRSDWQIGIPKLP
ncbi:MAG: DUF1326 domain-containing protein [Nitrospinae bacterium]|nr:DUF1326 domain-containing protein [Nitrospinota bacterium]